MKASQKVILPEHNNKEDSQGAPWTELESEDFHVAIYKDAYPVTDGHRLYVPKYNTVAVLRDAFSDAVERGIQGMVEGEWDGFNVGVNIGEAAGQTCSWPHVHLIPRRKGDMADPRGGVRHVIPEKGNYKLWKTENE
jgi:diadenosine tetraphosphate (Ap4A) HIT family hydrolase